MPKLAVDVLHSDSVAQPPELLEVRPIYPPSAYRVGLEGWVIFEVVVGADGVPERQTIRLVEYSDAVFVDNARSALESARYTPGKHRGSAVRVLITQPIVFRVRH